MNTDNIKWIENTTGFSPVPPRTRVIVKFICGETDNVENAQVLDWSKNVTDDYCITHYAVINKDSTTEKSYTLQDMQNLYHDRCFDSEQSVPDFIDYIKEKELKIEREYRTYLELKAKYENETKHRS